MSCVTSYTFPFLPCTPERSLCALLLALAFPLTLAASSPRGHIPKRDIIISSMSQSHLRILQSFCQVSWTSLQVPNLHATTTSSFSFIGHDPARIQSSSRSRSPPSAQIYNADGFPLLLYPFTTLSCSSPRLSAVSIFSWTLVILQCFSLALKTFSSLYYHRPYRLLALVSLLPGSFAVPK
jgi:hypothetical protein